MTRKVESFRYTCDRCTREDVVRGNCPPPRWGLVSHEYEAMGERCWHNEDLCPVCVRERED